MHYITKRLLVIIGLLELVIAAGDFCCGSSGVTTWMKLQAENRAIEQQIMQQQAENENMRNELHEVTTDIYHIERLARERLHMAGKDEMIFFY